MRKNIHPKLHDLTVQCRCGNHFAVISTLAQKSLSAEHCLKCLPMNTGIYQRTQDGGSARERLFKNFSISNLAGESSGAEEPS
jgi:ribosomal protein L31